MLMFVRKIARAVSALPLQPVCAMWGLIALLSTAAADSGEDISISEGNIVYLEYSAELVDGTVVSSNVGKDPVVYEAGGKKVLPALDRALRGRRAGESGTVRLSAAEAYGRVDESLFVEVPLASLPEDARKAGAVLMAENSAGEKQRVAVLEVRGEQAVIDYNHPLAGEEIIYYVRILDVK